ncbi:MAG: PKD domain-containing protein [Flavobacteriaceae bacterium]|nr:PKD domain-containing protein [Flavobacteriaceae bacterium]
MKKKILLLIALSFIVKLNAQTIVPEGDVDGNWTKTNSPYIVDGDINVINTLTIEPGVEIQFKDGVKMNIQGKLLALGIVNDSIKFSNYNDKWEGIKFIDNSTISEMKYFKLSGVRNTEYPEGALVVKNSNKIKISHGEIFNNSASNNGAGINLLELKDFSISYLLLHNNSLHHYPDGGGTSIKSGTAIMVNSSKVNLINITAVKNKFSNNSSASTIHFDYGSEVSFTNCIIQENESGAIGLFNNKDALYITNSNIESLSFYESRIIGENNFDESPSFVDYDNNDFRLKWDDYPNMNNKPKEIDGGVESIHDIDGSISDIGAISFNQTGVYFPPSVWFDADNKIIQTGTEVTFMNNSQKGSENIVSYLWNFGDGTTSNEENPKHLYTDFGKFNVSLKITDATGIEKVKSSANFIISGTVINEGNVSGVWEESLNPYIINGNIYVPKDEILELKQGVELYFSGFYDLKVFGDLKSIGTMEKRVKFTALDTINFWSTKEHFNYYTYKHEYNGWNGVSFEGDNRNSTLKYTDFSYRKNYGGNGYNPSEDFGGTVLIKDNFGFNNDETEINNFLIENCRFFNNNGHGIHGTGWSTGFRGAGINALRSNVTIKDCTFENNKADYAMAVYLWETVNSKIINNKIINNNSLYNAGKTIDIRAGSDYNIVKGYQILIKDNIIRNNSDGGVFSGIKGNVLIENNIIDNNSGGGIETHLSYPVINANIITNNSAERGAGINIGPTFGVPIITNNYISGNHVTYHYGPGAGILCHINSYLINNTIIDNTSVGIWGYGVFADNATLTAINNIVYGNQHGAFKQNNGGGSYPPMTLSNNYEHDPNFVDGSIPKLNKNSECIDTGTLDLPVTVSDKDLFDNVRIFGDGNKIDIGAVEYNNTVLAIEDYIKRNKIYIYPTLASDKINLVSELNTSKIVNIEIYNLQSQKVKEIVNYNLSNNLQNEIKINELSTGLYILSIFNKDFKTKIKFIKK